MEKVTFQLTCFVTMFHGSSQRYLEKSESKQQTTTASLLLELPCN